MLEIKSLPIIIGSLLQAIGINGFLLPYDILDGGLLGVSMVAYHLWGVKIGFILLLLNVPIYTLAWFHFRRFFYNSLHGMLISSLFIDFLSPLDSITSYIHLSPMECSILGGMFIGSGVGIMLRHQISTEGTELVAQLVSRKIYVNEGIILFLLDMIPICLAEILFPASHFFLSMLTSCFNGLMTSLYTIRIKNDHVR